jgi:hypothetical protein
MIFRPVGLVTDVGPISMRFSVSHEYIRDEKNVACLLPSSIDLKTIYADKEIGTSGYDILEFFDAFEGSEEFILAVATEVKSSLSPQYSASLPAAAIKRKFALTARCFIKQYGSPNLKNWFDVVWNSSDESEKYERIWSEYECNVKAHPLTVEIKGVKKHLRLAMQFICKRREDEASHSWSKGESPMVAVCGVEKFLDSLPQALRDAPDFEPWNELYN